CALPISFVHPDILEDGDRLGVVVAVHGELGGVGAGGDRRRGAASAAARTPAAAASVTGEVARRVAAASADSTATDTATAAATFRGAVSCDHWRNERPLHAMNARRGRTGAGADRAAARVGDRELDVARGRRAQVVADRRAARGIRAVEALVTAFVGVGAVVEQIGNCRPDV